MNQRLNRRILFLIIVATNLNVFAQEPETAPLQERANVFNPSITAFGTIQGCGTNGALVDHVHTEGDGHDHGPSLCANQFLLGEAEFDFRATIDPWAEGVFILALEQGLPANFEVEIEEGYVLLKQLPVINKAPLGLKLKLGRFATMFGRINRIHGHDLPQPTAPLSLQAFMGAHGMRRNGGSASFFIPTPGDDNSLEFTAEIIQGGGLSFEEPIERGYPAFLGHLSFFFEPVLEHQFELGASAYVEPVSQAGYKPSQLFGTDFNYSFKPVRQGESRSFFLGGEFMISPNRQAAEADLPIGLFAWAQYQFNQKTYLGIRYDHGRGIQEDINGFHGFGVFLTYYTTEFLRFRMGYERLENFQTGFGRNQFTADINFVFGSHPVEPYWVNK